jgi:hypothetical protein
MEYALAKQAAPEPPPRPGSRYPAQKAAEAAEPAIADLRIGSGGGGAGKSRGTGPIRDRKYEVQH